MSIAAVSKVNLACDCLIRARQDLTSNSYDPAARKAARKELSRAEALIKEARQAMSGVKGKEPEPEPEPEEEEDDQTDNGNGENGAGKEVDHEDQ